MGVTRQQRSTALSTCIGLLLLCLTQYLPYTSGEPDRLSEGSHGLTSDVTGHRLDDLSSFGDHPNDFSENFVSEEKRRAFIGKREDSQFDEKRRAFIGKRNEENNEEKRRAFIGKRTNLDEEKRRAFIGKRFDSDVEKRRAFIGKRDQLDDLDYYLTAHNLPSFEESKRRAFIGKRNNIGEEKRRAFIGKRMTKTEENLSKYLKYQEKLADKGRPFIGKRSDEMMEKRRAFIGKRDEEKRRAFIGKRSELEREWSGESTHTDEKRRRFIGKRNFADLENDDGLYGEIYPESSDANLLEKRRAFIGKRYWLPLELSKEDPDLILTGDKEDDKRRAFIGK